MKNYRNQMAAMLIGANRVGKSTIQRKLIADYMKANPKNALIVFDPQRRFTEFRPTKTIMPHEDWLGYLEGVRDALVVLDDYRALHTSFRADPRLNSLMINRCAANVDYIFACHNPQQVLNNLSFYLNRYYIMWTNTTEGQFENKIPNYLIVQKASSMMNRYAQTYGSKTNYQKLYPNFPYIMIDFDNEKNVFVNFDREKLKKIIK